MNTEQKPAQFRTDRLLLWIAVGNLIATAVFACLVFVMPLIYTVQSRARFTELDRAGAIDGAGLKKFHPSYGFGGNYRATVPDYITEPAASAQTETAVLGLTTTSITAAMALWGRRRIRRDEKLQQKERSLL
ncbi:MAG TPA: hypothetical protein VH518_20645 [Tepidisphaeraceae bacterium]|jgi:hypothetical protein